MSITARSNGTLLTKKPFKVLVCLVTLVAFLCNTVLFDAAWAAGTPSTLTGRGVDRAGGPGLFKELRIGTFSLPEYLGHVKDSWSSISTPRRGQLSAEGLARGEYESPVVIHIQDAHCNYYAQKKIAEIVEYINKGYGVATINLEGGAKEYDLSIFTDIHDKAIREKTTDYFVKEGLVNGSEYFAINNPEKVSLWGIEDTKLYLDNLNVYRQSLKHKDEIDKQLNALTHILNNLKTKIYSQELLELDKKYSQYKANGLEFKNYLNYLIQTAKQKAINVGTFTNIYLLSQTLEQEGAIDFKRANIQRDALIDNLQKKLSKKSLEELILKTVEFRSEKISQKDFYTYLINEAKLLNIDLKEFPELNKYIAYISAYDAIDKTKTMDEMESLEDKLREGLYENNEQKTLDKLSKNLAILKNIFNITLTREDYKYYINNEQSFDIANYISFVNKEAPLYKITAQLNNNVTDLDHYRENISKFYEYSFKRDAAFINNIKFNSSVIARSPKADEAISKTAILITGGFHAENLYEKFKKANISYISIMPNFKSIDGYECPYFKILSGEKNINIRETLPSVLKSSLAIPDQLNPAMMNAMASGGLETVKPPLTSTEHFDMGGEVRFGAGKGEWQYVDENGKTTKKPTNEIAQNVTDVMAVRLPDGRFSIHIGGKSLPASTPQRAVYAVDRSESYDDIVVAELAKQNNVSVDDLEADFEKTVKMTEERVRYTGFIQPDTDAAAQKIHDIFNRLIKVYQTQTQELPGNFYVVDANDVNAFVIRKRKDVYFYKGLYEALYDVSTRMKAPFTEDMIAFIIAHELSHALQHTSHQGLGVRDLNEHMSPYLVQMIKNGEYDADMRALELMDKAGYSVFGALDAMTFLEFITTSGQVENVLSSHPYVSLRKHKLFQIILDQKTNIFTNVKAPRTIMTGTGRMKSRDVDFRYLMDKGEGELLPMAQKTEDINILDELTGMIIIRKRMDALKALVNEDDLKTSFLRSAYIQAVLTIIMGPGRTGRIDRKRDYSNMKGAAAIYDFGMQPTTKNILETLDLKSEIKNREEELNNLFGKEREETAEEQLEKTYDIEKKVDAEIRDFWSNVSSQVIDNAKRLNHKNFKEFLVSPEKVEGLIALFMKVRKSELSLSLFSHHDPYYLSSVDKEQIKDAINYPEKIISAFFYANYLGQEPSVELDIPTSDMASDLRIKLYRRNNAIYHENPAYWDTYSADNRKKLQGIALLHYALKEKTYATYNGNLHLAFPGLGKIWNISPKVVQELFIKYHSLFSEKYPKPLAINLVNDKLYKYFGSYVDKIDSDDRVYAILHGENTPEEFVKAVTRRRNKARSEYEGEREGSNTYINAKTAQFIETHPFIIFIRDAIQRYNGQLPKKEIKEFEETMEKEKKGPPSIMSSTDTDISRILGISCILASIARVYSQKLQRRVEASPLFTEETELGYYRIEDSVDSFESLLELPNWAISEYVSKDNDQIFYALKDGTTLSDIFKFMSSRLAYNDRRKVFEDLFFHYVNAERTAYLLDFFKETFHNNPQEIILWFLGMFSKKDALELIDKLCCKIWHEEAAYDRKGLEPLTIALLDYVYSQTSKTFHASQVSVKVYLDLMNDRIEKSGGTENESYTREAVYDTLMTLSASVDLGIGLSHSSEFDYSHGTPDFKYRKTSINPGRSVDYKSEFMLHNFGWDDPDPDRQSIFIAYLTDLSIEQLRQLLVQRLRYIQSLAGVEYRGETFLLSAPNDFFANLITVIILKKIHNPDWVRTKGRVDRLDDLIDIAVTYYHRDKEGGSTEPGHVWHSLKVNKEEINHIPYQAIKDNVIGVAIPSLTLDSVWESYIEVNNLGGVFPETVPLLQNPNPSYNTIGFLETRSGGQRVSYRQMVKKFFMNSSVYADLFDAYCKLHGKGYVYGKYKPLDERLGWVGKALPNKSIIKDSIIDLWETDIFPEIIADLPALMQLFRQATEKWEDLRDIWSLLGEMDDDVGRLKRLNDRISLSPKKIHKLLTFYERIIPLVLSPQKIARYGATSYMLWKQLSENADSGLSENLDALIKFMPAPSVLRDELLMRIANRYVRHLKDARSICEKLYSNNLLSRNRDLRTEDFVSETLLHLFGGAKIEDRKEILLWTAGVMPKPKFVIAVENRYNIDFTTLPDDVKLLPVSIREKFIEGFMLGDNGVLDPQSGSDRLVMSGFLEQLFLCIFPEGTKGIGNEERVLILKIFLIVMKSFPPYRRVQVIKALAALHARPDFEKTSTGERLSILLGVLGPVGIKVAQYLSENETLVPDESMRSSLGALRHRAPEITKISACSALENEVPLSEVLVREIGEPAGVASIKQVNRGRWLDIKKLAELVMKKANGIDVQELKEKLHAYHTKDIHTYEIVAYIVEKAHNYKIDLENATVPVVFKIRRPNIEATLGVDFAALDAVAQELEGTSHKGETLNIGDLVQTVKEWVELEKNFRNEVRFHNMLTGLDYTWAEDLEKEAGVTIAHPRILYATDSLIVEEEIQGVPVLNLTQKQQPITMEDVVDAGYTGAEGEKVFNDLVGIEPRQAHIRLSLKKAGFSETSLNELTNKILEYDYGKLRELLRHMLLHQIFIDGVFHADLHQGNVLITPGGKLVMIDRGNVGLLNKEQIEGAKILLKGLLLREKNIIKQGIDMIFLNAKYPENIQPMNSRITLNDIQEILDKGLDLKMTTNMISVRTVRGAKNTPGGKDFSIFLKAFTQAMHLFPTDLSNGMATLQAIAQYISMNEEEMMHAAAEQAKYIVQGMDIKTDRIQAEEKNIMQIFKKAFYGKTDRYFLHSVWQPIIFRIMVIPIKVIISKVLSMRSDVTLLVRVYGRKVIEENIDEFIKRRDSEIGDAVMGMVTVKYAEQFLTGYAEHSIKERLLGRICSPVIIPLLKAILFLARPFTRIFVEATREWLDTTGKRYIASLVPKMTVIEGVDLLSQVFGKDFADIKSRFDKADQAPAAPVVAKPSVGSTEGHVNGATLEAPGKLTAEQIEQIIKSRFPNDPALTERIAVLLDIVNKRGITDPNEILKLYTQRFHSQGGFAGFNSFRNAKKTTILQNRNIKTLQTEGLEPDVYEKAIIGLEDTAITYPEFFEEKSYKEFLKNIADLKLPEQVFIMLINAVAKITIEVCATKVGSIGILSDFGDTIDALVLCLKNPNLNKKIHEKLSTILRDINTMDTDLIRIKRQAAIEVLENNEALKGFVTNNPDLALTIIKDMVAIIEQTSLLNISRDHRLGSKEHRAIILLALSQSWPWPSGKALRSLLKPNSLLAQQVMRYIGPIVGESMLGKNIEFVLAPENFEKLVKQTGVSKTTAVLITLKALVADKIDQNGIDEDFLQSQIKQYVNIEHKSYGLPEFTYKLHLFRRNKAGELNGKEAGEFILFGLFDALGITLTSPTQYRNIEEAEFTFEFPAGHSYEIASDFLYYLMESGLVNRERYLTEIQLSFDGIFSDEAKYIAFALYACSFHNAAVKMDRSTSILSGKKQLLGTQVTGNLNYFGLVLPYYDTKEEDPVSILSNGQIFEGAKILPSGGGVGNLMRNTQLLNAALAAYLKVKVYGKRSASEIEQRLASIYESFIRNIREATESFDFSKGILDMPWLAENIIYQKETWGRLKPYLDRVEAEKASFAEFQKTFVRIFNQAAEEIEQSIESIQRLTAGQIEQIIKTRFSNDPGLPERIAVLVDIVNKRGITNPNEILKLYAQRFHRQGGFAAWGRSKGKEGWKKTGFWSSSPEESAARQKTMPSKFRKDTINESLKSGKLVVNETNTVTINSKQYLLLEDFHTYHKGLRASYIAYLYKKGQVFGDPVVIKTVSKTKKPPDISWYEYAAQEKRRVETDNSILRELGLLLEYEPFLLPISGKKYVKTILDYQKYNLNKTNDGGVIVEYSEMVMPYYGDKDPGKVILKLLTSKDKASGLLLIQLFKQAYLGLAQILEAQIKKEGKVKFIVSDLGFYDDWIIDAYNNHVILLDLGSYSYGVGIEQISNYASAFEHPDVEVARLDKKVLNFFIKMHDVLVELSQVENKDIDDFYFLIDIFEDLEKHLDKNPQSGKELLSNLPDMLRKYLVALTKVKPSVGSTEGHVNGAILEAHDKLTTGQINNQQAAEIIIQAIITMPDKLEGIINMPTATGILEKAFNETKNEKFAQILDILKQYQALAEVDENLSDKVKEVVKKFQVSGVPTPLSVTVEGRNETTINTQNSEEDAESRRLLAEVEKNFVRGKLPVKVEIVNVEKLPEPILKPDKNYERNILNTGALNLGGRRLLLARRALDAEINGIKKSEIGIYIHNLEARTPEEEITIVDRTMLTPDDKYLTSKCGEVTALEDARVIEWGDKIFVYLTVVEKYEQKYRYYSALTFHDKKEFLDKIDGGRGTWNWSPLERLINNGPCKDASFKNFAPFGHPITIIDDNGKTKEVWVALYRPDMKKGSTIRYAISENGPRGSWRDIGEYKTVDEKTGWWLGASTFVTGIDGIPGVPPIDIMLFHIAAEINEKRKYYDIRALVSERDNPLSYAESKPIIVPDPKNHYEYSGWVSGTVYSCGAILTGYNPKDNTCTFDIYYSGSDSVVLMATVTLRITPLAVPAEAKNVISDLVPLAERTTVDRIELVKVMKEKIATLVGEDRARGPEIIRSILSDIAGLDRPVHNELTMALRTAVAIEGLSEVTPAYLNVVAQVAPIGQRNVAVSANRKVEDRLARYYNGVVAKSFVGEGIHEDDIEGLAHLISQVRDALDNSQELSNARALLLLPPYLQNIISRASEKAEVMHNGSIDSRIKIQFVDQGDMPDLVTQFELGIEVLEYVRNFEKDEKAQPSQRLLNLIEVMIESDIGPRAILSELFKTVLKIRRIDWLTIDEQRRAWEAVATAL